MYLFWPFERIAVILTPTKCQNTQRVKFPLKAWKYKDNYGHIGLMSRVLVNGPEDQGSIHTSSHTKDSKTDAALLNTQHYKVKIKGKSV